MQLVEGERDVINMEKIEGGMSAVINSLKHEYTTSVVTRITPCKSHFRMQLLVSVSGKGSPYGMKPEED